ncbi:MAG: hypothetical protein RMJ43_01095 [Chloroherpetonaceae bacterium]|nr:hypothetical protein [Chthonomonadaceae bacterium]MDW8206405.1 hypothetical protein [Chloroherpetonaceae bacterium]
MECAGWKHITGAHRGRARAGLSTPELLVVLLVLIMIVGAVFALFRASWQSYDNLVWQTRVNLEARQSLDDICDMLRTAGNNIDMTWPSPMSEGQVDPISTPNRLTFLTAGLGYVNYRVFSSVRERNNFLTRWPGASMAARRKVGQFIRAVEFEYEYRLPATGSTDRTWRFVRVSHPALNPLAPDASFLATTVYVTVHAEARPYGDNGPIYRRSLTGAVRLRGPHGLIMPPAVYTNVPRPPETVE